MKKYLIYITTLLLAGLTMQACEDNREAGMLSDMVYLRQHGIVDLAAYSLNKGEVKFDLWAYKGGNLNESGDVEFILDPSMIMEYNEGRPESQQLSILPRECYRVPVSRFHVSGDAPAAKFYFYYDPDVIAMNFGTGRRFALPVRIKTTGVAASPEQSSAMIIFNVEFMQIGFAEYPSQTREIKKGDSQFNEKLTITLPSDVPENVNIALSADKQSYVDAYNYDYGTSYTLLPDDYYSFANPTPVMPAGSNTLSVSLRVNVENLPAGQFILPVAIDSVKGMDINPQRRIFYFIYLNSDVWLTTASDKDNWSIVNVSSTGIDENTGPIRLIDGMTIADEKSNYWGVNYNAPIWDADKKLIPGNDQWVILDLGSVIKVGAIRITPRSESAFDCKLRLYVSDTALDVAAYTPERPDIGGFTYSGTYVVKTDNLESIWTPVSDLITPVGTLEYTLDSPAAAQYLLILIPECRPNLALSEIDVKRIK